MPPIRVFSIPNYKTGTWAGSSWRPGIETLTLSLILRGLGPIRRLISVRLRLVRVALQSVIGGMLQSEVGDEEWTVAG
jgi:hypothetical protein